jgi:hypothetical protein
VAKTASPLQHEMLVDVRVGSKGDISEPSGHVADGEAAHTKSRTGYNDKWFV